MNADETGKDSPSIDRDSTPEAASGETALGGAYSSETLGWRRRVKERLKGWVGPLRGLAIILFALWWLYTSIGPS